MAGWGGECGMPLLGKVVEKTAQHRFSEVMVAALRLPGELAGISRTTANEVGKVDFSVLEFVEAFYTHIEERLLRGDFAAIFNTQTASKKGK